MRCRPGIVTSAESRTIPDAVHLFALHRVRETNAKNSMSLNSLFDASLRAPRLAGRGLVQIYRHTLSPLVGFNCRHLPTCSDYADQALDRFGLWAGGWMIMARLLRCQPWGTSGLDFVSEALPAKSRWYMPWRYGRWRGTNRNSSPPHALAGPDAAGV
jgi:putative membrane protein insertion efficiency factor